MKTLIISIIIMAIMAVSVFAVSANAATITSATRSSSVSSRLKGFIEALEYNNDYTGYATCHIDGSDDVIVIVGFAKGSYGVFEVKPTGVNRIGTIAASYGTPYTNGGKLAMCKTDTDHNAYFYYSVRYIGGCGLILSRDISGDLLDGKYPSPSIPGKPIELTSLMPKAGTKAANGT